MEVHTFRASRMRYAQLIGCWLIVLLGLSSWSYFDVWTRWWETGVTAIVLVLTVFIVRAKVALTSEKVLVRWWTSRIVPVATIRSVGCRRASWFAETVTPVLRLVDGEEVVVSPLLYGGAGFIMARNLATLLGRPFEP